MKLNIVRKYAVATAVVMGACGIGKAQISEAASAKVTTKHAPHEKFVVEIDHGIRYEKGNQNALAFLDGLSQDCGSNGRVSMRDFMHIQIYQSHHKNIIEYFYIDTIPMSPNPAVLVTEFLRNIDGSKIPGYSPVVTYLYRYEPPNMLYITSHPETQVQDPITQFQSDSGVLCNAMIVMRSMNDFKNGKNAGDASFGE